VQMNLISREQAREAIDALDVGVIRVPDLASVRCDPDAISLVAKAKARRWMVVPMRFDGDTLVLAATETAAANTQVGDDLRLSLRGRAFRLEVAPDKDLAAKLDAEYRNEMELVALAGQVTEGAPDTSGDTAVRMVDLTLDQAITDRASDIHVEPGVHEVHVRYRIDGVLIEKPAIPKQIALSVIARLKIISGIDIAESRIPQDGRLSVTKNGKKIDMRVSSLPTVHGEKIVLRILDSTATRQSFKEFEFSDANEARWMSASKRPSGLLLVTGPTGSGKSTTLYATLNELARPEVNIVTVEDPVEYRIPRINQVQINPKAGLTFASALRSILRQDPDIILLGEIRDRETAQIAIEAALTGHLVLSTLHTNSAPEAATRLSEMGIDAFLVGSVLECALAQRLVRRLCVACRRPYDPDPAQLESVGFVAPAGVSPTFFAPTGCARCSNTGYKGRLAVHETMVRTPALEHALVRDATVDVITELALADGMVPMRIDGWAKVASGLTTIAEVLRVVA
ncbi:MAG TPA: GspE/PulE family protein, partial [Cellulomonadaceae bacterium]|nr:GspE/PulE family protein [Cellulomonadaceae bacterium]